MPYRDESDLMQDAPEDTGTELGFVPANGPFNGETESNTVVGTLTNKRDKDWVGIELSEWTLYSITVGGSEMLTNTTLGLFDSNGNLIVLKDDEYSDVGNLHVSYRPSLNVLIGDGFALSFNPKLFFTPSLEGGDNTQKYFIQAGAYLDEEVNSYVQVGQYTGAEDNDFFEPAGYTVTVYETISIDGTPGSDRLEGRLVRGLGGNDILTSAAGSTGLLFGGGGNDRLEGGDYFDYLQGGPGADELVGGDGYDIASYAGSPGGVTVRLHSRQARGGDASGDTWSGADVYTYSVEGREEIEVSLPDIEDIKGSGHADLLAGDFRNNTIWGGAGDDKLYGGPGPAELGYVDGLDPVVHKASGEKFWSFNRDSLYGEGGNDKLYGGPGDDKLYGGSGNDELYAGAGIDYLYGGEGDDTLVAGVTPLTGRHPRGYRDVDYLYGGPGADTLVGNGNDVAYYDSSPTGVTVRLHSAQASGGHAEGDIFAGTGTYTYITLENYQNADLGFPDFRTGEYSFTTNSLKELIHISFPGTESLVGSPHNDILAGDFRDNGISGGDGDDRIYGGPTPTEYKDLIRVSFSWSDPEGDMQIARFDTPLNNDSLSGEGGNDKIYGGSGDDRLNGGSGDDILKGGPDSDDLVGGDGDDILYGGDGSDVFWFDNGAFGHDRIMDFEDGIDKLDFRNARLTPSDLSIVSKGSDTVIEVTDTDSTVILIGIDAALIGQDDFIF